MTVAAERHDSPPPPAAPEPRPFLSNRALLLPCAAPYFAYVALSSSWLGPTWAYGLRLAAVPALLAWAWRWYPALTGPRNPWASAGVGATAGLVGTALWVALVAPFTPAAGGEPWTGATFWLRLAASALVVPLFEEILMRGYFLRAAVQWDLARRGGDRDPLGTALDERSIVDVEPGAWTPWAVVLATAAFTSGHQVAEWPASVAYGLLMIGLWVVRRDLLSCVVAHGVTNAALAFYVRASGQWGLW